MRFDFRVGKLQGRVYVKTDHHVSGPGGISSWISPVAKPSSPERRGTNLCRSGFCAGRRKGKPGVLNQGPDGQAGRRWVLLPTVIALSADGKDLYFIPAVQGAIVRRVYLPLLRDPA